jgi:hypothetical protein
MRILLVPPLVPSWPTVLGVETAAPEVPRPPTVTVNCNWSIVQLKRVASVCRSKLNGVVPPAEPEPPPVLFWAVVPTAPLPLPPPAPIATPVIYLAPAGTFKKAVVPTVVYSNWVVNGISGVSVVSAIVPLLSGMAQVRFPVRATGTKVPAHVIPGTELKRSRICLMMSMVIVYGAARGQAPEE